MRLQTGVDICREHRVDISTLARWCAANRGGRRLSPALMYRGRRFFDSDEVNEFLEHLNAPPEKHMSLDTIGKVTGKRWRTVRSWTKAGLNGHKLPAVKIGRQFFVPIPDLAQFLIDTGLYK